MCPLCPCSGTTAQYGGGGACVPYVPVVVLQHSMEEEEHVSLCPCSGTTAQYGGGEVCVPYVPLVVLQHSMEEAELVSPMQYCYCIDLKLLLIRVTVVNTLNAKCVYACMHIQPLHHSCMG